jgi:hypothetical protein
MQQNQEYCLNIGHHKSSFEKYSKPLLNYIPQISHKNNTQQMQHLDFHT